jgi:hypothetical protein
MRSLIFVIVFPDYFHETMPRIWLEVVLVDRTVNRSITSV